MSDILLQAVRFGAMEQMLLFVFLGLCVLLILFVLFRQTDSQGLAGAFGGASLSGEGAFGAKGQRVADKVIAWMAGIFMVMALLLAYLSSGQNALTNQSADPASTTSDASK